jgi:hypothetical protein
MGGECGMYGGEGRCLQVFVGRPEETRSLGRPRRRGKSKNKTDLQEVGYVDMGWINLAQDKESWWALVNAVMQGFS